MGLPFKFNVARGANSLLLIIFMACIWLPFADTFFMGFSENSPATEKRNLAKFPEWSLTWECLEEFPREFEAYYNDHFGFRQKLISMNNRVKVNWLKVSPSARVVVGKQGWLYYAGENSMDYYRAIGQLDPDQLETWRNILVAKRQWLANRRIAYAFMVAPSKESIYPEFIPDRIVKDDGPVIFDQLNDYLGKNTDFRIIDVRRTLIEGKKKSPVYHMADSHWTELGAYLAYARLIDSLGVPSLHLSPLSLDNFTLAEVKNSGGDLARMTAVAPSAEETILALHARRPRNASQADVGYPVQNMHVTAFENKQRPGPRAVMFCDSFGDELKPYLAEHFSRIVYVQGTSLQIAFDVKIIEKERPDIVIDEMAERKFIIFPPMLQSPD
jgi:alginate O-acetyltransferase complex protein AlgJ